jgi:hypothetical protein
MFAPPKTFDFACINPPAGRVFRDRHAVGKLYHQTSEVGI